MSRRSPIALVLCALLALTTVVFTAPATAQVQEGATMTVLRGQVAVVRSDASAVQPAPSGTVVRAGDEIRTLTAAGALITFFAGTEIEMGEDTIMVVDRVSRQGERVDVSLRQVLGVSLNRVATLTDPGSSYQITAGGAVAFVRGTTFAVVGPVSTSVGDVVVLVCLEDCDSRSTFAGCPLAPFTGLGVVVEKGRIDSGCVSFRGDPALGYFESATQGITAVEQTHRNTGRQSPGVLPPGQQGAQNPDEQQRREEQRRDDDDEEQGDDEVQRCGVATVSGGAGVTRTQHDLGQTSGTFRFDYNAFSVPDRFDIFYEGRQIFTTGGFVSGANSATVNFGPGPSTNITVVVTGSSEGTFWTYTVNCPAPAPSPSPSPAARGLFR